MRSNKEFNDVLGINDLAIRLLQTRRNILYPLIYRIITLALTLPISTTTVEKIFSAMNTIKAQLFNRISNQVLVDYLVIYIEKDIFDSVDNETIIKYCF